MPPPTLGSCKLHGHRHLASQSAGPRPKVTSGDLEKGFPRARGRHCRAHCCPQARALGRADMPRTPQGGQGQVQGQRVQGAPTAATQRWEGQRARGAHSVDLQVVDPAEVQLAVCRRVLWRKAQPVVQGQHPAGHLGTGQWPRDWAVAKGFHYLQGSRPASHAATRGAFPINKPRRGATGAPGAQAQDTPNPSASTLLPQQGQEHDLPQGGTGPPAAAPHPPC